MKAVVPLYLSFVIGADAFHTPSGLLLNSHRLLNPPGISRAVRIHPSHGIHAHDSENKQTTALHMAFSSRNSSKATSIWTSKAVTSITSHRVASMLYILTSVVLFATGTPNRLNNYSDLALVRNRHKLSKLGGVFGFIIAAYTSRMLADVASYRKETDSKSNDGNGNGGKTVKVMGQTTMRKLNFGLLLFAGIGVGSLPGEASFHPTFRGAMYTFTLMQVSRIIGFVASFRGWLDSNQIRFFFRSGRGLGFKLEEIQRALQQTWTTPTSLENERGIGLRRRTEKWTIYSTLFALVRITLINNVICLYNAMKNPAVLQLNKSLYVSAIARLSLITVILSTLKRAAAEKQLSDYPYKSLSYLISAWVFSVGVASGFIDEKLVSWILQKAVYLLAFAFPIMIRRSEQEDQSKDEKDESK